jgi:CheY-like chemotaxis protein
MRDLNVLVADDQLYMRNFFCKALSAHGYKCDAVADGRECLRKMAREKYDVLFLDLIMPILDGDAVLRIVKQQFPGTDVVVASLQDDEGAIREILRAGAVAYLVKPFTIKALMEVMTGIEARRDLQRISTAAA